MKSAVIMTAIGINELLLSAMSASEEVNIRKVSLIAPKLNRKNNIASILHLFISRTFLCAGSVRS
jgi:hypothetical protein